jgi:predicted ArsR family transcriptional regulator
VVAAFSNILKETRSQILLSLKNKGRMSVEGLASSLGVSKVSVRRHLDLLRRDGLVAYEVQRQDRGRPGHIYFLTQKAETLFPTGYSSFALKVLNQVRANFGESGVAKVLSGQADELINHIKPELEGLDLGKRIEKLVSLINDRGYDITVHNLKDGSYLIKQRNCPILKIASEYNQCCSEELRVYQTVLEAQVFRECRIAAGARSCDYVIMPSRESEILPEG